MGKGETRRRKTPSALRGVIAANVLAKARALFPTHPNLPMAIREASGTTDSTRLTKSTIQRILDQQTSATLEQLDGLGRALKVSPYNLLLSPDVIAGLKTEAERFYAKYLSLGKSDKMIVDLTLEKAEPKSPGKRNTM